MELKSYLGAVLSEPELSLAAPGDFDSLLQKMQSKAFNGCLRLTETKAEIESEGLLFLWNGVPKGACCTSNRGPATGSEAIKDISQMVRSGKAHVTLHPIAPELLAWLCRIAACRIIHSSLSTEFVNLPNMLGHLRENAFDGYVHILFANGSRSTMLAYRGGIAYGCLLWPAVNIPHADLMKKIAVVAASVQRTGAVFSIYQTCAQGFFLPQQAQVPLQRQGALELLSACLSIVEQEIKRANPPQSFEDLLVDTCIELTDRYAFLHPYSGDFQYKQGVLTVSDAIPLETLLASTNAVLEHILKQNHPPQSKLIQTVRSRILVSVAKMDSIALWSQLSAHIPILR